VWVKSIRAWLPRELSASQIPVLDLTVFSTSPSVNESNLTTTLVYYAPLLVIQDTGSIASGGAKVGYTWPLSHQMIPLAGSTKNIIATIKTPSATTTATVYVNIEWALSGQVNP
jgi:hypothetical protein